MSAAVSSAAVSALHSSSSSSSHIVVAALSSVLSSLSSLSSSLSLPHPPRLVAVSKTKPVSLIEQCLSAGQHHFGENYVSELLAKAPLFPPSSPIKWHFIGHLQRNKAGKLVKGVGRALYMVESVDSKKLAKELNKQWEQAWGVEGARKDPLKVLVQVNTSGEGNKSGVEEGEVEGLFSFILEECAALDLKGLMTIGAVENTPDSARRCFTALRAIRDRLLSSSSPFAARWKGREGEFEMSMGMSADYAIAVECGSTNVRVGSTIFGPRDYSKEMKDYEAEDKEKEKETNTKEGEGEREEKKK